MSPTIRHKYKYFHSTVQRAKGRRPKFHYCRLPFDVRPRNVKLNLSNKCNLRGKMKLIPPRANTSGMASIPLGTTFKDVELRTATTIRHLYLKLEK